MTTAEDAVQAGSRGRLHELTGRVQRLTLGVLLPLVLVLVSVAIVTTERLSAETRNADASASVADGYQDARYLAAYASGLRDDFLLHREPAVAAAARAADTALQSTLQQLHRQSPADQQQVAALQAQARGIDASVKRLNALISRGRITAAAGFENRQIDPATDALTHGLSAAEKTAHIASQAQLDQARDHARQLGLTTPIVLAGSVLVALLLGCVLRRDRRRIETLAATDPLTGLPNRLALARITQDVLTRSTDRDLGSSPVLLLLDLDRFKEVNDGLGHHYGDRLLIQVAARLRGAVAAGDTVARLGGDEFVVLLPTGGIAVGETVADRIRGLLRQPFLLDAEGLDVGIDVSIGIANASYCDPSEPAALMRAADVAMYAAKQNGGGHVVYTPELDAHTKDKVRTISQLWRAVERDELVLHYQPKIGLDDGRLLGVEALLRWQHPSRGQLAPGEFLPLVEDHEIMDTLTGVVVSKALQQAKSWLDSGTRIPVAVNVATRSLLNASFPAEIGRLLTLHQVDAALLCLEITETSVMRDTTRSIATLNALHTLGVRLSVDDYGTGYASMVYLKDLPIDELKIDRSFVTTMATDERSAVLTRSVIDLGHNLGLTVVAEGVEDADVSGLLRANGCDCAQGYFYSRPIPPEEILNWRPATNTHHQQSASTPTDNSGDDLDSAEPIGVTTALTLLARLPRAFGNAEPPGPRACSPDAPNRRGGGEGAAGWESRGQPHPAATSPYRDIALPEPDCSRRPTAVPRVTLTRHQHP